MAKSITNGNWTRIGDNALGFGIWRYTRGSGLDEKILWRLEVTKNSNSKLIEIDATTSDLREIARWCERAIETLQDDGGRETQKEIAAEAAA